MIVIEVETLNRNIRTCDDCFGVRLILERIDENTLRLIAFCGGHGRSGRGPLVLFFGMRVRCLVASGFEKGRFWGRRRSNGRDLLLLRRLISCYLSISVKYMQFLPLKKMIN